VWNY
jgi:katanin p60 ATPase-containing subunit A1